MTDLVNDLLRRAADRDGDREVLRFDDETLTCGELDASATRFATGLAATGVRAGDRVLVLLGNRPEMAVTLFGLARLGAVAVPVNAALKGAPLAHVVRTSGAPCAVVEASLLARLLDAVPEVGDGLVVTVGEGPGTAFADVLAAGRDVAPPAPGPGDPWAVMFTSGTTGPAKGAVLPHGMVGPLADGIVQAMHGGPDSVWYTCSPLYHLQGLVYGLVCPLVTGTRAVVRGAFPGAGLAADLRAHGATIAALPPFVLQAMLDRAPSPDDVIPLRVIATIGLDAARWRAFEERFGVAITGAYGPTETGLITAFRFDGHDRAGTAGRVLDRFEAAVVDGADRPLPSGEVGELVVRPRGPFEIMQGYLGDPDATVETWRNLWFHTGDTGSLDAEGHFTFSDRLKDMVKTGGRNVSSFEVEQVIATAPGVVAAAVVAHRDPAGTDETVRAFVVPRAGEVLDLPALVRHCDRNLAHYMVPRYLDICAALPVNALGKIQKAELRARPLDAATFDRRAAGIELTR